MDLGGRHVTRHPPRRRGPAWLPFAAGALAAVCVIAALLVAITGSREPEPAATPCRDAPATLTVLTAPDQVPLLNAAASAFTATGPTVGGRCGTVSVRGMEPADAGGALARGWDQAEHGPPPDVWVPPSSAWLHLLTGNGADELIPARQPSLARSPLVIAMPQPMASELGWPREPIGWADLVALERDPRGWGAVGRPEWGAFTLGMTDPAVSTAGLHALLSMYAEVTGRPSALPATAVNDQATLRKLLEFERALTDQPGDTSDVLAALRQAELAGKPRGPVSAFPATEQAVWAYNQGTTAADPTAPSARRPRVPLAAVYPEGGAHELDLPYLVLNATWVDADRRELAAAFLEYLQADATWELFRRAGYRAPGSDAGFIGTEDDGLEPDAPAAAPRPATQVIALASKHWSSLHRRGSTLAVIDVSGSMRAVVPGRGQSRLDLARQAAIRGLELFGEDSRVGLWSFSEGLGGAPPYKELVPLGEVGEKVGGVPRRDALAAALRSLTPGGGTALYDTTLAAVRAVRADWQPGRINAVVLLTDGTNEDAGSVPLEGLLAALRREAGQRPVPVIAVGYGAEADMRALNAIAEATGGVAYHSRDPADIEHVFLTALSRL